MGAAINPPRGKTARPHRDRASGLLGSVGTFPANRLVVPLPLWLLRVAETVYREAADLDGARAKPPPPPGKSG